MRIKGRLPNNALWRRAENCIKIPGHVRDEEDCWEVKLREAVEPTKVENPQLSLLRRVIFGLSCDCNTIIFRITSTHKDIRSGGRRRLVMNDQLALLLRRERL
jgi:hypothetical protein